MMNLTAMVFYLLYMGQKMKGDELNGCCSHVAGEVRNGNGVKTRT